MKVGDVVRLKTIETFLTDGRSSFTFKRNEGRTPRDCQRVFVCILLGDEMLQITNDRQALNLQAVMTRLGWQPIPLSKEGKLVARKRTKKGKS